MQAGGNGIVFPNDDAYIYLHNAQVFWSGQDSSYPGVSPLTGTTSSVFFAGLLLFETCIRAPEIALYIWCLVAAVALVGGLYAIGINAGCSAFAAAAIAVGSLLIAGGVYQLINGLDTGLAIAAVAWALALLTSRRRGVAFALLIGVMPFIRPELALLSLASIVVLLLDDNPIRRKVALIAIAGVAALPFALWLWRETGSPIPSSVPAKEYFFAEAYLPLAIRLEMALKPIVAALLLTFPLALFLWFIRPAWLLAICVIFIMGIFGAYLIKLPDMLAISIGRYMFILLPVLSLGIAQGVASRRPIHRKIATVLIGLAVIPNVFALAVQQKSYSQWSGIFGANLRAVAEWTRTRLPAGSVIMVHDAGYIAYRDSFRLIDMVGLKTPGAILVNRALTYPSAGRDRGAAIAKIAFAYHPQYLIDIKNWETQFGITEGLRQNGWALTPIYESPAQPGTSPAYIYRVYALTPPNRSGD